MQRRQLQENVVARMSVFGLGQCGELRRQIEQARTGRHQAQRAAKCGICLCCWPQRAQFRLGSVGLANLQQGKGTQSLRHGGDCVDVRLRQRVAIQTHARVQPQRALCDQSMECQRLPGSLMQPVGGSSRIADTPLSRALPRKPRRHVVRCCRGARSLPQRNSRRRDRAGGDARRPARRSARRAPPDDPPACRPTRLRQGQAPAHRDSA